MTAFTLRFSLSITTIHTALVTIYIVYTVTVNQFFGNFSGNWEKQLWLFSGQHPLEIIKKCHKFRC
jgi:hypothetical protein